MRRIVIILLGIAVGLIPSVGLAQEATPEPTEPSPHSIFSNDTCAPPCWFGLIPGVSTAADALVVLENEEYFIKPDEHRAEFSDGEIDSETGYLVDGQYNFDMSLFDLPFSYNYFAYSHVYVQMGTVDEIMVRMNEFVTLREALAALGTPDQVRLEFALWSYYIEFIYLEPRLRITLTYDHGAARRSDCYLPDTLDNMWVDIIIYYSPESAIELRDVWISDTLTIQQPALTAYGPGNSVRYVPQETWESWLLGEVSMSCEDAWFSLPEEMILPEIPVGAATPTATATPES